MEKKCLNCGNMFTPPNRNKGKRYCTASCWNKSPEHRKVAVYWKGKNLSRNTKEKMSLAKVGKQQKPEHIEKRTAWAKGYKWKKSTIEKRRKSNSGQVRTGKAYQNILEGVARAHGYKSYASIPHQDNPDWRGPDWKKIREKIKKRDKYTCQAVGCGSHKRLQVHHKINWKISHDNSSKNLVTLCINHHQQMKGTDANKKPTLLR